MIDATRRRRLGSRTAGSHATWKGQLLAAYFGLRIGRRWWFVKVTRALAKDGRLGSSVRVGWDREPRTQREVHIAAYPGEGWRRRL